MRRRRFLEAFPLGVAALGLPGAVQAQTQSASSPGPVSVLDFIPGTLHEGIRNGTNTVALDTYIQSAIDARPSEFHGVNFPPGIYLIASEVWIKRSNISLLGERAMLLSSSATASHLRVGDGTAVHSNIDIRNLIFAKTVVASDGFAIDINRCTNMKLERLLFYGDNKLFGCVRCFSTIRVKVINCDAEKLASGGMFVMASGTAQNRLIDLHVRDCEIYEAPSGFGVSAFGYAEGLYIRRNTFFACGSTGVALSGATEEDAQYSGKIDQNDFDSCGVGVYVRYFDNLSISDNWFSNNSGTSLWLNGGVDGVFITGGQIYANSHYGIDLDAVNVIVSGILQHSGSDGLVVRSQARNVTVSGSNFVGNSGYGINLTAQPQNLSIVGNTVRGNAQGQITGTAANSNIANNLVA